MSVASILNKNDDVTFAEIVAGTITCDTITARVINGGGGGGGSIPTLSEVCAASGADPVSAGGHVIGGILELDLTQNSKTCAIGIDPTTGFLRYTTTGWSNASGILYDTHYNQPSGGAGGAGGALSTYINFSNNSGIGIIVPGTTTGAFVKVLQFNLPSPCTTVRFNVSAFNLYTSYSTTQTNPTTFNFSLGNLVTGNGLDGDQNAWSCVTTIRTGGHMSYPTTLDTTVSFDLWYTRATPFSTVLLCVQTTSSGNVEGDMSVLTYGLLTASNDVAGTITVS